MVFKELASYIKTIRFYKENPTSYLGSKAYNTPNAKYFGIFKDTDLIAATSYVKLTDNLAMMQSTMVEPKHRGIGVGRYLNEQMEEYLKSQGYGKIVSHVYIDNLPSIILKLKLGYIIEGTLRDHDVEGQDEYILGKILN